MAEKMFKGTARLVPWSGGGVRGFRLLLEDETSGTEPVVIEITDEQFGKMFSTGSACEFAIRPGAVGKKREVMTKFVPRPDAASELDKDEERTIALGPLQVDGWKARKSDYGNHHRSRTVDGVAGYNVAFTRFVDEKA